ncbi:hypothetical protein [Halocalculus aciditolerans]|uniref:Uncharacterized protein n=1 Tax=Halocalculus aciditolerans TaxID=1383812 RepID=A0A830EZM8_9EURY|nr:hypothetical protein [Halocalculus aciditolerans]GGL46252.1 hypothetical protein GCM10009039_00780 [Halocalculus aciditolerans]
MDGRDGSDSLSRAARVLAGREVHWTLVALSLLVLAAFLPVGPLRLPGYLVLAGFDAPQNAFLPGLGGAGYWAGVATYLYLVSLVVGGVLRAVLRAVGGRERRVNPRTKGRRRRALPSPGMLATTAKTLAGPEVVGVFVVLFGLGYAGVRGVPVFRVPGQWALALLDWGVVGATGSTLALASMAVTAYALAIGIGNAIFLLRR